MENHITVNILNNDVTLNIMSSLKLGEGSYGSVYFFNKNDVISSNKDLIPDINYVIKISKSNDNFSFENYVYKKYENFPNKIDCLPKCFGCGTAVDQKKRKAYYYIVLEYVGYMTLKKFLTLLEHNFKKNNNLNNELFDLYFDEILKNIYASCLLYLDFLHQNDMICRDVKPENIIVSDYILSYFIQKVGSKDIEKYIPQYIINILPVNVSLENIKEMLMSKNYTNIIKFIDVGLFGDVSILESDKKYDKKDKRCWSNFIDFDPFDPLFISTITYLSPLAMFNFSHLISVDHNYDDNIKKDLIKIIKILMKLSDFWCLNLIFARFFCSLTNDYTIELSMDYCFIKECYNNKSNYTYKFIDSLFFDVDLLCGKKRFFVKKSIEKIFSENNRHFCKFVSKFMYEIINLANYIAAHTHTTNIFLPFYLNLDGNTILEIRKKLESFLDVMGYDRLYLIFVVEHLENYLDL